MLEHASRSLTHRRALLLATGAALAGLTASPALAAEASLLETGSSLLYPLFNLWVAAYTKAHKGLAITTQSTGSGTGISQAISGLADIGASDAYLSDALMRRNPGMLNIPLAVSSQTVNVNIPELRGTKLRLSGPVLAAIYGGTIRMWNDQAIAALNPGVTLPAKPIVAIHRADGSGDTFIFTQYLAFSTPSWEQSVGYGTTVAWPATPGALGANGNPGMVNALATTPYAIAYIGISFAEAVRAHGLGPVLLQNRDGKFPESSPAHVTAAANSVAAPPDGRVSLVFRPGADAYPISNYEYAIVEAQQHSRATAAALRAFLAWAIAPDGGNAESFLEPVGFAPLPTATAALSARQIATIA